MSRLAAIRMPRKVSMPQWNGRSVRFRLLAIALLPTLVILPLLLGIAAVRWNERFDATLISKVNGDLTIAHQYLAHLLERTGNHVQALGLSVTFQEAVTADGNQGLKSLLEDQRKALGLDFLYLAQLGGGLLATAPRFAGAPMTSDWPIVASAFSGTPQTAIDIFSAEELATISPDLVARARLDLVPTRSEEHTSELQSLLRI